MTADDAEMRAVESREERFLLAKHPGMITNLLAAAPANVTNIVDLGIFKGGSAVLYDKLFSPRRIVAIDRSTERVGALDDYIRRRSSGDVIRPYYGVDQGDEASLTAILTDNFQGRSLDLVVDDCSHLYGPTKASLNVLFPALRSGGLYVIEDWGWAHWRGEPWQSSQSPFGSEPALSNLVFEVIMLTASRPELVSSVRVTWNMLIATRGADDVDGVGFDISTSYVTRGRRFLPTL